MTECFPDTPLDGELWMGRGTFHQTSGIVRRVKPHEGWRYLAYYVFDAPTHGGLYEARQKYLEHAVKKANCPFLKKIPVKRVKSRAHLDRELATVLEKRGEGPMIVRPRSAYTPRRTDYIIEVRKAQDAEATVVEHVPGKGRHRAPKRKAEKISKKHASRQRAPSRKRKKNSGALRRRLTSLS